LPNEDGAGGRKGRARNKQKQGKHFFHGFLRRLVMRQSVAIRVPPGNKPYPAAGPPGKSLEFQNGSAARSFRNR